VPSLAILVSAVLVLSRRQTHRQNHRHTESQMWMIGRYTDATTVSVGNYGAKCLRLGTKMVQILGF